MRYLQIISVVLFCLISLVNGNYYTPQYSRCKQFENKIYQLTVTFPGGKPLYAGLRLLPNGMFDEIFSIGNGHSEPEVGADFALSTRYGYYKCLSNNQMRLTAYGYLYKSPSVSFLAENGAVVMHDYLFKFDSSGRTLSGKVQFAVFKNGENPFETDDTPAKTSEIGVVKGELLKFRKRFDLSLN